MGGGFAFEESAEGDPDLLKQQQTGNEEDLQKGLGGELGLAPSLNPFKAQ